MGHWREPVLLFILPKKPQEMNDFSSFLAVFFYGLMSQSLFCFSIILKGEKKMYQELRKAIERPPLYKKNGRGVLGRCVYFQANVKGSFGS